jgi:hypothetical protein
LQTNGTLNDTNLRALLETAQAERATGTLTVRDGNGSASTLYFLFGHLFHAVGDGIMGDEAVVRALRWPNGDFDFDAKAKLPADETVRGSIGDLVQQSEKTTDSEPATEAVPEPEPAKAEEPAPEPVPEAEEPAKTEEPAEAGWSEPAPVPEKAQDPEPAPAAAAAETEEPPPQRRGVKFRPSPKHGREPFPVPAGQVIYDSLKTSFVDFPRLITTLEREAYTGYVRLLTESVTGLILFKDGAALECAYDAGQEPTFTLGTQALVGFNEEVTNGSGVLDVVSLSGELVDGLHELMVATPMYSDLYASWVDPKALLKFLEDRKLSGSLMVHSGAGVGVIILTDGKLTGAYTSDSLDISDSADGVLALCKDDDAVIEVKSAAAGKHESLDVDGVVGSRKIPTGTTQIGIPVYRPEAETPAAAPAAAAPPAPSATEVPAWQPEPASAQAAPTNPTQPVWQPDAGATEAVHTPTQATPAQGFPTQPGLLTPPPMSETAPAGTAPNVDWEAIVNELQAMTEDALGNRSRKVKDVLASAERSPAGLDAAIQQVPTISILFVDSSRLEALAGDLRNKLHSYLG